MFPLGSIFPAARPDHYSRKNICGKALSYCDATVNLDNDAVFRQDDRAT
jgi:hypothetical protein